MKLTAVHSSWAHFVFPWLVLATVSPVGTAQDLLSSPVTRGDFEIEVVEMGNLASAKQVDIRCEIDGGGNSPTAILWVIPEGSYVKKGDLLAKLDPAGVEDQHNQTLIQNQISTANLSRREQELKAVRLAKQEFEEGILPLEELAISTDILAADNELRVAKRQLAVVEAQAEASKEERKEWALAVQLAEQKIKLAEMKRAVLEKFTKPKMTREHEQQVTVAEAHREAARVDLETQQERLQQLKQAVTGCQITSPAEGYVVYGASRGTSRRGELIEEGATVRKNQLLMKICDFSELELVFRVHESVVGDLEMGMPAEIRVAALPDRKIEGQVSHIDTIRQPAIWLTPDLVEYEVRARLNDAPPQLRDGMTATVRIVTQALENVLRVPNQCILAFEGRTFCLLRVEGGWQAQEVRVGPSNDRWTVIQAGLEEGDEVALNPPVSMFDFDELGQGEGKPPVAPRDDPTKTGTPQVLERMFSAIDRNQNDLLEEGEIPARIRAQMKQLDTNQDGNIDRAELKAWLSRQEK